MSPLLSRVWNSPTFTTWGKIAVESLRVLAITPLVLTRFDQTEIAAWYLFSSLLVFGTVISLRVSLTFSRMVAFAMGGATDLSPITNGEKRGSGEPNWDMVRRVYSTVGTLNLITALLASLSGAVMGAFALSGLLTGYAQPAKIWRALAIFVGTQSLIMGFSRYEIMLKGMNFVALTNRWSVVFALLSTIAGLVAFSAGADIVELAVVMQSVQALNVVRMRLLVRWVHGGRLRDGRSLGVDRQVFGWAWPPFWKGLCASVAGSGVLQLASIVYARCATVEAAASYLFSLRMLQVAGQFSEAPLLSHAPRMSRLMATGGIDELRVLVCRKAKQSQLFLAASCLVLGVSGPYLLQQIGSNADFLTLRPWALLTTFFIAYRYLLVGLRLPAMSNLIVSFKQQVVAAGISAVGLLLLVPHFGFTALVLAVFLPPLVLVNLTPFAVSASMLEMSLPRYLARTAGWSIAIYAVLAVILSITSVI